MLMATIRRYFGEDLTEYIEDDHADINLTFPWDTDWETEEEEGGHIPDEQSPLRWCNGAGIISDNDSVRVWISTGDPRGAFVMTIYRCKNGEMRIELPYEGMGLAHEEIEKINDGLLLISRTKTHERNAA